MKKIIVVSAYKETGKSTLCDEIRKELVKKNTSLLETMFAKRLKEFASRLTGHDISLFEDKVFKNFSVNHVISEESLLLLRQFFPIFSIEEVKGHIGKQLPLIRNILQYYATEILRRIDPNIHIKLFSEECLRSTEKVIIVSDLRFFNERDCARSVAHESQREFIHIAINAHGTNPDTSHESEKFIKELEKEAEIVIDNHFDDPNGYEKYLIECKRVAKMLSENKNER